MKRIAMLLAPAAVLVAAASAGPTSDPRGSEIGRSQSGAHMNRHVDAHVPARQGEPATTPEAPALRRATPRPSRGWLQPVPPAPPSAMPPVRDRRY